MKPQNINIHAEEFAGNVSGIIRLYKGLYIVTYNYGSSPSVAVWERQQKHPIQHKHFIYQQAREQYIRQLEEKHDRQLRFRSMRRIQRKLQPVTAIA